MSTADPPKQRYQGVQKESAGYKLMTAMGWKEGEGLGASKQGIKEHIRVKKNFENWGVGAVTAADRAREWTTGMADFHRVLSTLSEITSQHAGKRPDEDDSDEGGATTTDEESDASDGELKKKKAAAAAAEKEKRSKKKDKKEKKKKDKKKKDKKRKSKSSGSESDKGDDSSESDAEDEGDGEQAPKRVKLATHLGRFKKRENAKMVKNYSSHDLAAILGADPFAAAAAALAEAQPAVTADGYESDSESDSDDAETKPKSTTKTAPSSATKVRFAEPISPKEEAVEEEIDTTEYWWSNYFVRGGKMGSLKRSIASKGRGFSEQDQTNLYNAAHDGATQGRVGLGRSSMPKKVAGARWEGKRMKLGSDDDESENEEEEAAIEAAELERLQAEEDAKGVVIVLPGGKKLEQEAPSSADGGAGKSSGSSGKKTKWKKVVAEVLKGESKGMKMKALQKAVMEREGISKDRKNEVAEAVAAAVEGSSKFTLDGKVVRLSA